MAKHYVNFGYPNTILLPLVGFDLVESSPVYGIVREIKIDSPSEFVEISCRINQMQILPQEGGVTIRTYVPYPINRKVNAKDSLVVSLDNHDPVNTHTPSIVWEIEETPAEAGPGAELGEVT